MSLASVDSASPAAFNASTAAGNSNSSTSWRVSGRRFPPTGELRHRCRGRSSQWTGSRHDRTVAASSPPRRVRRSTPNFGRAEQHGHLGCRPAGPTSPTTRSGGSGGQAAAVVRAASTISSRDCGTSSSSVSVETWMRRHSVIAVSTVAAAWWAIGSVAWLATSSSSTEN